MGGEKGTRRYFVAEKREAYLEGLRRTGNHAAAAREAGITPGGARRYRRRFAGFEAACAAAEAEAQRRLAGAQGAFDGAGAFEGIRRGADGRLKIQALGKRRWSRKTEDRFFAVLRECGNIAASARAVGVSREAVWKKRRTLPAFERRFGETMEEATIVLEFRMACLGTAWAGDEDDPEGGREAAAEAGPPAPFDPELAMRFLKWRADLKSGRRGAVPALPSVEAVRERIVRKVAAIRRHKALEAKRREEG